MQVLTSSAALKQLRNLENTKLPLLIGWAVPTVVGNVKINGSSGNVGTAHLTKEIWYICNFYIP